MRTVHAAVAAHDMQMPSFRVVMELGTTHHIVSAVARSVGMGWVTYQDIRGRALTQIATGSITDLSLNRSLYIVRDTRRALP